MADIKSYPLIRHLRGNPTLHVRHLRRGRAVHDGTGLSFWFRPLSAVLSEIPVDDRELPLLFHARTADFQDLAVQASVTFRVTDPAVASSRIDFSVDPDTGRWRGTPWSRSRGCSPRPRSSTSSASSRAAPCRRARAPVSPRSGTGSSRGSPRTPGSPRPGSRSSARGSSRCARSRSREGAAHPRAGSHPAGGGPVHLRTARGGCGAGTGDRRKRAAEQDRARPPRGAAARAAGRQRAAAGRGRGGGGADRVRGAGRRGAGARRGPGGRHPCPGRGEGRGEAASVAAYRDLPSSTLLALAAKDLAGSLPQIGTLVLSPDMLASLLAKLASGAAAALPGQGSPGDARAAGRAGVPAHRAHELLERHGPAGRPRSTCAPAAGGSRTWRTGTKR